MVHTTHASQRTEFIDLHQDVLSGVTRMQGGFPDYGSAFLTGQCRTAAVFSSLYPDHPETSLLGQLREHDTMVRAHGSALRLITTLDDLDSADSRIGLLPHSEGLQLPDVEPEALEVLWAAHSLRSLSLTWNHETAYGFGSFDDAAAPIKAAGRRLLSALEASPIFLDLAHLNDAGFHEALDRYAPPVLVTHTFCRSIVDHPRGLTDAQLLALGEHGGLVGLAFPPDFLGERGTIDEALRHIDRIARLAGEEALAIGSDWGVAEMGELAGPDALVGLLGAVERFHGAAIAERFAFANAMAFLRDQLPEASVEQPAA